MNNTVFVDFHQDLSDLLPSMPLLNPFVMANSLALFGGRLKTEQQRHPKEIAQQVVRYLSHNRLSVWQLIVLLKISSNELADAQNDMTPLRGRLGYQLKILGETFLEPITLAGHKPTRVYAFVYDDQQRTGYQSEPDGHLQLQEWTLDNKGYLAEPIDGAGYLFSRSDIEKLSEPYDCGIDLTGERTDAFETLSAAAKTRVEDYFGRLTSDVLDMLSAKMSAAAGTCYGVQLQIVKDLFLAAVSHIKSEQIDQVSRFQLKPLLEKLLKQTHGLQAFKDPNIVQVRIPEVSENPGDTSAIMIRMAYLIGLFVERGDACLRRFDPDQRYCLPLLEVNEAAYLPLIKTYLHRLTEEQNLLRRNMDRGFSADLDLCTAGHCGADRNINTSDVDIPVIRKHEHWHHWVNKVESGFSDAIDLYASELEAYQTHVSKSEMQTNGEHTEDINVKIKELEKERRQRQEELARSRRYPLKHDWRRVVRPIDGAVKDWFGCQPTLPIIVTGVGVAALLFILPFSVTYLRVTGDAHEMLKLAYMLPIMAVVAATALTSTLLCWWRRRKLARWTRKAFSEASIIGDKLESDYMHNLNHIKALCNYQVAMKNHTLTHFIQRQLHEKRRQMRYHETELESHIHWAEIQLHNPDIKPLDTGETLQLAIDKPVVMNPIYFPCVYAQQASTTHVDIHGSKRQWTTKKLFGLERIEFSLDQAYPEDR